MQKGRDFEAFLLKQFPEYTRNTKIYTFTLNETAVKVKPDFCIPKKCLVEAKNTKVLAATRQIRAEYLAAKNCGMEYRIIVNANKLEHITQPLLKLVGADSIIKVAGSSVLLCLDFIILPSNISDILNGMIPGNRQYGIQQ